MSASAMARAARKVSRSAAPGPAPTMVAFAGWPWGIGPPTDESGAAEVGGRLGGREVVAGCRERGAIGYEGLMAVFVALGAFLMTLAGGWTAQRVTDRRHLVLGLAGGLMLGVVGLDLLPEALKAAGEEVFGVPAALLLFVAGFLLAHLVERLLAARQVAHGAEEHDGRAPEVGLTAAAAMVGHSAMDGVAIGAAFQVGGGMGLAVALAVIAHRLRRTASTRTRSRACTGTRAAKRSRCCSRTRWPR